MKFRSKMRKGHSKRTFRKGAKRVNRKNRIGLAPMRGGIRL